MAQTNSNASNVVSNTSSVLTGSGGFATSNVLASSDVINTALNSVQNTTGGFDSNTENGNYATAVVASNLATPATTTAAVAQLKTLFGNVATQAHFLPTNGVTFTSGEFGATGDYRTVWTATPTKLAGTASAFTLTDTADSGKTFTLAENISGSPFTTGNGALTEALTFKGTANDTLVVKHNVSVANVPATTNNNTGSALDVRGEAYSESYAKQGVTSNYALNTSHKYTEANGNQALNDALTQSYGYKDANLTINSAVKTAVSDGANINGAEKIVESNVANYHYANTNPVAAGVNIGTIDYVVTDVRNLAQADQRTYTNITTTNVAQYKVVDKTVTTANGGALTVEASGVITGTTTNLSTAASLLPGATAQATTFAPTNAKFTVNNNNYSLAVDASQFKANALNQNVFDNVLDTNGVAGTGQGLGNGGTLFAPIDGTHQPVVPATLASAKYFDATGTTFTGTDFADVIKVTDTAAAPFTANINAGAGNDTITGGFGADVINGGAGADSIITTGGNDTINNFQLGIDALTVSKGTSTATVTVINAGVSTIYNIAANATADTIIPATAKTAADLALISGVKVANPLDHSAFTTAETITGTANADTIIAGSGATTIIGALGADNITLGVGSVVSNVVVYKAPTAGALKTEANDTVTNFTTGTDKIQLPIKFAFGNTATTAYGAGDALKAVDFVDANTIGTDTPNGGRFVFDATAKTLSFDKTGDGTSADDFVVITGISALTAADFIFA
ncbi:MAG: hypothetical protein WCI06_07235 [Methylococcaceae bacterium]